MTRKDISDRAVCLAVDEYRRTKVFPYDTLQYFFNAPFKVCWAAINRAYDRGLIECGVSLRTGWLTDKGKDALG